MPSECSALLVFIPSISTEANSLASLLFTSRAVASTISMKLDIVAVEKISSFSDVLTRMALLEFFDFAARLSKLAASASVSLMRCTLIGINVPPTATLRKASMPLLR